MQAASVADLAKAQAMKDACFGQKELHGGKTRLLFGELRVATALPDAMAKLQPLVDMLKSTE